MPTTYTTTVAAARADTAGHHDPPGVPGLDDKVVLGNASWTYEVPVGYTAEIGNRSALEDAITRPDGLGVALIIRGTLRTYGRVNVGSGRVQLDQTGTWETHAGSHGQTIVHAIGALASINPSPTVRSLLTAPLAQAVLGHRFAQGAVAVGANNVAVPRLESCNLSNLGPDSDSLAVFTHTRRTDDGLGYFFKDVRATNCGMVNRGVFNAFDADPVDFDGVTIANSRLTAGKRAIEISAWGVASAATRRRMRNIVSDRPIGLYGENIELDDVTLILDDAAVAWAAFFTAATTKFKALGTDRVSIFVRGAGGGGSNLSFGAEYRDFLIAVLAGDTTISPVFNAGVGNGVETLIDLPIVQSFTGNGIGTNDIFSQLNPTAPHAMRYRRMLIPCDGVDKTKQTAAATSPIDAKTNLDVRVEFSTIASDGRLESGVVKMGETQGGPQGVLVQECSSNVVYDPDPTQSRARVISNIRPVGSGGAIADEVNAAGVRTNLVIGGSPDIGDGIGYGTLAGRILSGGAKLGTTDLVVPSATPRHLIFADGTQRTLAEYWSAPDGGNQPTTGSIHGDLLALAAKMAERNLPGFDAAKWGQAAPRTWMRAGYQLIYAPAFGLTHDPAFQNGPGISPMDPPRVAVPAAGVAAGSGSAAVVAVPQYGLLTPTGSAGAQASLGTAGLRVIEDAYVGECLGVLDVERVTARPWDTVAEVGIPGVIPMLTLAADSDNEIQLSGVKDSGRPAGGLLRPASGLTIAARLETLDGLTVAGATNLPCSGSAATAGEWLLKLPASVLRGLAGSRYVVVFSLTLGTGALEVAFEARVQRLGAAGPRGLAGVRAVRARAGRTARPDFATGAPVPPPPPPPTAVPIAASGAAAAVGEAVVVPVAVSPDALDVPILLQRFDGASGLRRWRVAVPECTRHRALSDDAFRSVRLYRADTGALLPCAPPTLAIGARRVAHTEVAVAGTGPIACIARFLTGADAPLAPTPTVAVPDAVGWPSAAADWCEAELVDGPVDPRATRDGVPAEWALHDDDHARRHALEVAAFDAEYAAWLAAGQPASGAAFDTIAFMGRGGFATAYDPPPRIMTEGMRDGGAAGNARVWFGLRLLDRYARFRCDPIAYGQGEQWAAYDALATAYWLTGHDAGTTGGPGGGGDGWRRRAAFALANLVGTARLFLYDGVDEYDVHGHVVTSVSAGRRVGNVLRGWRLAARLHLAHAEFTGLIGGAYPYDWQTTPEASLAAWLAERVAAGRTAGVLRGSWGGTDELAAASADPAITGRVDYRPGAPTTVFFQVLFALTEVCHTEREASVWGMPLSPGTLAGLRQVVVDAIDYYAPMCRARALGAGGEARGWGYQIPMFHPNPENANEHSVLNVFGALPALRAAEWGGTPAYVTLADRLLRDHWAGLGMPNAFYDDMGLPLARKVLDESYRGFPQALAVRAAIGASLPSSPWDAAFSTDFGS